MVSLNWVWLFNFVCVRVSVGAVRIGCDRVRLGVVRCGRLSWEWSNSFGSVQVSVGVIRIVLCVVS